jgi:hypothetical protein
MNERLPALRAIETAVRQDIRHEVRKMVEQGWEPGDAAHATVSWWVTQLLAEAVDGARDVLLEQEQ